ncbi:hypothetical protein CERSUDRAFT_122340 [Gelatoporia subvermispora B]|uniref:Uncharacterized protein n=1 Tax=Ceriporiopsis subvermispora (strain B) TaxID=914234 RepID=M2R2K4_CERS8|nr:hypothetical protein CERSUDRAFT_122340 [Gelatoporia subvermispora B]
MSSPNSSPSSSPSRRAHRAHPRIKVSGSRNIRQGSNSATSSSFGSDSEQEDWDAILDRVLDGRSRLTAKRTQQRRQESEARRRVRLGIVDEPISLSRTRRPSVGKTAVDVDTLSRALARTTIDAPAPPLAPSPSPAPAASQIDVHDGTAWEEIWQSTTFEWSPVTNCCMWPDSEVPLDVSMGTYPSIFESCCKAAILPNLLSDTEVSYPWASF